MAHNPTEDSRVAPDHSWIGKETLETVLLFSTNGATRIPRCLIGRREVWEKILPTTSDRICSQFLVNHIPMYEDVFQEISDFPFLAFK